MQMRWELRSKNLIKILRSTFFRNNEQLNHERPAMIYEYAHRVLYLIAHAVTYQQQKATSLRNLVFLKSEKSRTVGLVATPVSSRNDFLNNVRTGCIFALQTWTQLCNNSSLSSWEESSFNVTAPYAAGWLDHSWCRSRTKSGKYKGPQCTKPGLAFLQDNPMSEHREQQRKRLIYQRFKAKHTQKTCCNILGYHSLNPQRIHNITGRTR
jgi:hypothetical protein